MSVLWVRSMKGTSRKGNCMVKEGVYVCGNPVCSDDPSTDTCAYFHFSSLLFWIMGQICICV